MNAEERLAAIARARALVSSGAARSIRIAARVTQPEVATVIRSSVSTVSRWESRDRLPRGDLAVRYVLLLERLMNGCSDE